MSVVTTGPSWLVSIRSVEAHGTGTIPQYAKVGKDSLALVIEFIPDVGRVPHDRGRLTEIEGPGRGHRRSSMDMIRRATSRA